jgi:hypothetical protein
VHRQWYAPVIPAANGGQLPFNMGGDRLLAVTSAKTTLSFQVAGSTLDIGHADCILIITQLQ